MLFPGPMSSWNVLIQEEVSLVDPPSSLVVASFVSSGFSAQEINAFLGLLVLNSLFCMNRSISGVSLPFFICGPSLSDFPEGFLCSHADFLV